MRSVYKLAAPRNPKAVKRAALIGIILGASVISLWLLLAWLGKTESNYRQPEPGMRYGIPNEIKQTNSTPRVYQPSRFTDGEVSIYKVRVEKGILTLPAGKVTFTADLLDANGTKRWQFTLKGSAIGGLVMRPENRSDELVGVAIFQDKAAYTANADDPEQHKWFLKLRELLEKLGEDLSEEELQQAFHELDQDSSGQIEFFEFVEWFTSEE